MLYRRERMPTTASILASLALAAALAPQDPDPVPATGGTEAGSDAEAQSEARPQKLAWPRDRDRVICRVGGEDHTLADLIAHLDARHYPGMSKLIETPSGAGYFGHPLMAGWVRQYADVVALETVAKSRGIDYSEAKVQLGDSLRKAFEVHLGHYVERREREGNPVELTQDRVDLLLARFQREHGLGVEVQGWLDVLVPSVPVDATGQLRTFYEDHPQWFGGAVDIAQILVQHRDPQTLELKTGEAREEAYRRLADVRARLKPDGSNFEAVARLLSEDGRTAGDGGLMTGIRRFDDRLPAAICRTAWQLEDGEVSEPFESPFGIHIVKRLGYEHLYYVIFHDDLRAQISDTMRRSGQENELFGAREKYGVELLY